MINDELNTAFRWYDDILKQNRYKTYCGQICDFKLLTPLNSILPFQIRTEIPIGSPIDLYSWKILCTDGTELLDLTDVVTSLIYFSQTDGVWYMTNYGDIGNILVGKELACGTYYSVLSVLSGSDVITFYSEVFDVMDIEVPISYQIDPSLFTAWRWYDNQQKQNRFKDYCSANCGYYLIVPSNQLLPFMFRRPTSSDSTLILSWVLRNLDEDCETNLNVALLHIQAIGAWDYIYYNGDDITEMPCGKYQSIININGNEYFSEPIDIIQGVTDETNYLLQETGSLILQEDGSGILLE